MFTVKAIRKDIEGRERMHLYTARSVDVLRDADGLKPGESYVIFREMCGDQPAITVTNHAPSADGYTCNTVFIENSNGKTTEIVRAFN